MPYEFVTNLIRPWDKLNDLLVKPYAFQPDVNDPLRDAANIAIAIRHQSEKTGIPQKTANAECQANEILLDVADAWKHGRLRDPARNNTISISSRFEFESKERFRFIRNVITVEHSTKGSFDLIEIEGAALAYWHSKLGIMINWIPVICEAPPTFTSKVVLFFNPEHQIHMEATKIQFVCRDTDGRLVLADPEGFEFEIREIGRGST